MFSSIIINPNLSKKVVLFCFVAFSTFLFTTYQFSTNTPAHYKFINETVDLALSENYFKQFQATRYLVDNNKCRIPDIESLDPPDPFSKSSHHKDCKKQMPQLTYVANGKLLVRGDVKRTLGLKGAKNISCCYKTIERIQQNESAVDGNADKIIRFSATCYEMGIETEPIAGSLYVECRNGGKVIYKNMHLVSQLNKETKIQKKKAHWDNIRKTCKNCSLPPNVVIIGIDSTSRRDFHRFLPKTVKLLDSMNALELEGYAKLGGNTFPNFVPLMTSYTAKDLVSACNYSSSKPIDNCPFLWKRFADRQYITSYLEDTPMYNSLSYMNTGFWQQPTDIYLRPWALAAYQMKGSLAAHIDCIGYERPEEIILNYVNDQIVEAEKLQVPYFITTWLTDLSHNIKGRVKHMDGLLSSFLTKLNSTGVLNNTILVLLSDHGYHYGEHRMTMSGWFEDKMPGIFLKLPERLFAENPTWAPNSEINKNQLTTPLDIHATILHAANLSQSFTKANSVKGHSILSHIPDRSCTDSGIPDGYCPCRTPVPVTGLSKITKGAQLMIDQYNSDLPSVCSQFKLNRVLAAAEVPPDDGNGEQFIVTLETSPGEFKYEGEFVVDGNQTRTKIVQRTSKLTRSTRCLSGQLVSFAYRCYCKKV